MDEGQIRKKYNITGCEHCPYFVEVVIKEGEPRYGTEFFLKEIISNAEIKNLVIDLRGYEND